MSKLLDGLLAGPKEFVKGYVNDEIQSYGKLTEFKIDPKSKSITANFHLKGEESLIQCTIHDYSIVKHNEEVIFKFSDITVSREWIDALAKEKLIPEYAPGNQYKLQGMAAEFLFLLL